MNTVFITLGSLGLLPFAAHVTAVSLGGVAIAVMLAANIIGDVAITRRMFASPGAYLYALTPSPRWKILLASVLTMMVMDLISMTFVITTEVWLSFNLTGIKFWDIIGNAFNTVTPEMLFIIIISVLMLIAGYLLILQIILFCITAKKSILYKLPVSGLLVFLLACGCIYAVSLLQLLIAPFGIIERYAFFFVITFSSNTAYIMYTLLTLFEAAGLFLLTSKLLEKRINI
jgi:hypothetical protein